MAGPQLVVFSIADTRSFRRTLRDSGAQAQKFSERVRGLKIGAGGLSASLLSVGGLGFLSRAVIEQTHLFDAADNQLQAQMKVAGTNSRLGGKAAEELGQRMERFGFTRTEVEEALTYNLRATDNFRSALRLTALDANIARGRHIALAQTAFVTAKFWNGFRASLTRLGIVLPHYVSTQEGLAILDHRFAGQAAAGTTVLDRWHAVVANLERAVGVAIIPFAMPAFQYVADLAQKGTAAHLSLERVLRKVKEALGPLVGAMQDLVETGRSLYADLGGPVGVLKAFLALYLARRVLAVGVGVQNFLKGLQTAGRTALTTAHLYKRSLTVWEVRGAGLFANAAGLFVFAIVALGLFEVFNKGDLFGKADGWFKDVFAPVMQGALTHPWEFAKTLAQLAWQEYQVLILRLDAAVVHMMTYLPFVKGWAQKEERSFQARIAGIHPNWERLVWLGETAGRRAGRMFTGHLSGHLTRAPEVYIKALTEMAIRGGGVGSPSGIIAVAFSQLGIPYKWGGRPVLGSPTDCSGLMVAVFAANGIRLPRTAAEQYSQATFHPSIPLPGDLVFYDSPHIGHVALYIGDGRILEDPHTGASVHVTSIRTPGSPVGYARWWTAAAGDSGPGTAGGDAPGHGGLRAYAALVATRYGVPPALFVAQIQQESGFNPNARSSAGAIGIAQFMPATAAAHGIDPTNPWESLRAAAQWMGQMGAKYGNWFDPLSVYNSGRVWAEGRHISETYHYVTGILAAAGMSGAREPGSTSLPPSNLNNPPPQEGARRHPRTPGGEAVLPDRLRLELARARTVPEQLAAERDAEDWLREQLKSSRLPAKLRIAYEHELTALVLKSRATRKEHPLLSGVLPFPIALRLARARTAASRLAADRAAARYLEDQLRDHSEQLRLRQTQEKELARILKDEARQQAILVRRMQRKISRANRRFLRKDLDLRDLISGRDVKLPPDFGSRDWFTPRFGASILDIVQRQNDSRWDSFFYLFDQQTQQGEASIQAIYDAPTPAEEALTELQRGHDKKIHDQAWQDARDALRLALAGGDPEQIKAARAQIDALQYQDDVANLTAWAAKERTYVNQVRDKELALYERRRELTRAYAESLKAGVDAWLELQGQMLQKGLERWRAFFKRAKQAGVPPFFWVGGDPLHPPPLPGQVPLASGGVVPGDGTIIPLERLWTPEAERALPREALLRAREAVRPGSGDAPVYRPPDRQSKYATPHMPNWAKMGRERAERAFRDLMRLAGSQYPDGGPIPPHRFATNVKVYNRSAPKNSWAYTAVWDTSANMRAAGQRPIVVSPDMTVAVAWSRRHAEGGSALDALLHEMTHEYQSKETLADRRLAEGGAVAHAAEVMHRIWGRIPRWMRPTTEGLADSVAAPGAQYASYEHYVYQKIRSGQLPRDWIESGQFAVKRAAGAPAAAAPRSVVVDRPTLMLVGETGPEAVVPVHGPHHRRLRRAGRRTVHVWFGGDVDAAHPDAVAVAVASAV